jgi:thiol-disulfide isomerase/thioredoxin
MRKILIALFVLAFVSTAFALEINQDAPLFSLRDTSGQYFHLSDHITPSAQKGKGKSAFKGIILNFFSSTCVPCKTELPVLNSLTDEFNKKGIKIVIVGYGEKFGKIEEYLNELKVDKPIILSDVYSIVGKKYGVIGLPHTVIISADGKIKDIIRGELPEIEKVIREKAGRLLK